MYNICKKSIDQLGNKNWISFVAGTKELVETGF